MDGEAVRSLVRLAYSKYVERIGAEPAPMNADYPTLIAQGEVWVAEEDGLLGVVVMRARGSELLLENVAVHPKYQGRGIGRALIDFAEARARDLGLGSVTLYTNEAMNENLRLYPSLGYREVRRSVDDGFRRVHFEKQLE